MGRAAFLLESHKADERARLREEAEEAQEEQEQRGSWGGWGKLIGGVGLPMLVAAISGPIGWAAAAGWAAVGSYAGQKAGRSAAEIGDKEDKTKISKGKFFKGETDDIQSDIDSMGKDDETMLKEALWDGAMAGAMSIGKEGIKAIGSKVASKLPAGAQDFAAKKMGFTTMVDGKEIADVSAMTAAAEGESFKGLFTSESMWGESMGGFKPTSDSYLGERATRKAYEKQFAEQTSKITDAFGEEIESGVFQGSEKYVEDPEFTKWLDKEMEVDYLKDVEGMEDYYGGKSSFKVSDPEQMVLPGEKELNKEISGIQTEVSSLDKQIEAMDAEYEKLLNTPDAKKLQIQGFNPTKPGEELDLPLYPK